MRKSFSVSAALSMVAAVAATSEMASAQTAAYWRFEDRSLLTPTVGQVLNGRVGRSIGSEQAAGNTNADEVGFTSFTSDSSGNGNGLRTFNAPPRPDSEVQGANFDTSPMYTNTRPFAAVPNGGAANNFAFDFDDSDDIYSQNVNGAAGPINNQVFNAFTVEASFRPTRLGFFQNVVGKDGKPTDLVIAPFQLKIAGDSGAIFAEFIDASGAGRILFSDAPATLNQWHNVAFTNDGATASLYVDATDDGISNFILNDSVAVSGGLFPSTANWTVGRGAFNGGITDFFQGQIDEVRISNGALATSQFLANVPEPTTLAAIAGAGLVGLRRRRAR